MKAFLSVLVCFVAIGSLQADPKTVVQGNSKFAWDLYDQLKVEEGNLFYSPFSISTALSMTAVGARENTLKEMLATLHLADDKKNHEAFKTLLGQLSSKKKGYEISTANSLWGQTNYRWEKDFLGTTKQWYGAGLQEVDFIKANEAARKTINAWVEKETKDKIKELLKPGILSVDTRLVLTNAIHFKGTWVTQFDKKMTQEGMFTLPNGKTVKVPMMHVKDDFNFAQNEDATILEMPYSGKELSMIAILPKKVDGLPALEKKMSADRVSAWLQSVRPTEEVTVTLPKFKFESEFSLKDNLIKMGMKDAFSETKANFAGMNGKSNELFISAVVHKGFVDVNEEGTEAAAATAVVARLGGVALPNVFHADHPFVFVIRHNASNSILFVGRVNNPK